MKSIIFIPIKKAATVLRHVFIDGNANNVELAQVAIPMIVIATILILTLGHATIK